MTRHNDRFWTKGGKTATCWDWTGLRSHAGYGHFRFRGGIRRAHRVAWELTRGPIPDGLCVLHSCDNPSCVRPDHLFLGTNADNIRDKTVKGRAAKGEINGNAKLTAEQVRAIRSDKRLEREIAADFGIVRSHVRAIKAREKWAHLAEAGNGAR